MSKVPEKIDIELSRTQGLLYDAALAINKIHMRNVEEIRRKAAALEQEAQELEEAAQQELMQSALAILEEHGLTEFPYSPCNINTAKGSDGHTVRIIFEPRETENSLEAS